MKNLSMMTWKEIKALNKEKSIAFVVLAPIEEHGCCLPLATDLLEGEFWSRGAMSKIEESLDAECFYLPTFPIAAASVTEFYGSVHFTMKTTFVVTLEILESLRCMDFKHIIVIASHADPQHQIAVEKAVRKVNRKYGICAISPMGPIFMGAGIEQSESVREVQKNHADDFHAGWIETSSLLDMDKSYVRDGYDSFPDSKISDRDMIFKKKQLEAMGKYGHIGSPRLATAELGKDLNENCIDSICDAVVRFYNRNGYQKYSSYFLYKILPLHFGFLSGKVKRRKGER